MSELILRFASKNRQKVGVSLSHDFTTKFKEPIKLSYDMKHDPCEMAFGIPRNS